VAVHAQSPAFASCLISTRDSGLRWMSRGVTLARSGRTFVFPLARRERAIDCLTKFALVKINRSQQKAFILRFHMFLGKGGPLFLL
jgi:hypothetical protein